MEHKLPEIVVTATRSEIAIRNAPSSIYLLNRSDLDRALDPGLSTALSGIPGVFIKDLGGLNGIKSISLRGTASHHTLFLFNGVRINSYQNGMVDLGLISTDGIDRIEVVRGGQSGLYGPDAVSGTINLRTLQRQDSLSGTIDVLTGSFGLSGIALKGNSSNKLLSVDAGYRYQSSRGDYKFRFVDGQHKSLRKREFADANLSSAYITLTRPLTNFSSLQLDARYHKGDRGSPGPYITASSSQARLYDEDLLTMIQYSGSTNMVHLLSASVYHHYSFQKYVDRTFAVELNESYKNQAAGVSIQGTMIISPQILNTSGIDLASAILDSRVLKENIHRIQSGLFSSFEISVGEQNESIPKMTLFPMIRFDHFSDASGKFSYRMGMNMWLTREGELQLRASGGKSFRIPTFNELYWKQGGNPDLDHEISHTYDLSLVWEFDVLGKNSLELGYFGNQMRDQIVGWPPVNISRSSVNGLEVTWDWRPSIENLRFQFNSSYQRAVNKNALNYGKSLPFVPQFQLNVLSEFRIENIVFSTTLRYTSHRYTTTDNDPIFVVPSYLIINAGAGYKFKIFDSAINGKFYVDNLLNTEYEIMKSYPMPLRNYRLLIKVTI